MLVILDMSVFVFVVHILSIETQFSNNVFELHNVFVTLCTIAYTMMSLHIKAPFRINSNPCFRKEEKTIYEKGWQKSASSVPL